MISSPLHAEDAETANCLYNKAGVLPHEGTDADMPLGTVAWMLGKSWLTPAAEGVLVETWRESQGYQPEEHGFRALAALWHLAEQVGGGRVVWHAFHSLSDIEGVRMNDVQLRARLPNMLLDHGQEMAGLDVASAAGFAQIDALDAESNERWPVVVDGSKGEIQLGVDGLTLGRGGRAEHVELDDLGALWRTGPAETTMFIRGGGPRRVAFGSALECQDFCDAMKERFDRVFRIGVPTSADGPTPSLLKGRGIATLDATSEPPSQGWYPAPDGSGDDQWWTGSAWGPKRI